MKPPTLLTLLSSGVLLFPVVSGAFEMPQIKPGLWGISEQHSDDGAALTAPYSTQSCLTEADMESAKKTGEDMIKKSCSKNELRKEGGKWINSVVCKIGGQTVSTQTTAEFNGDIAYRTGNIYTYAPPVDGHSRTRQVIDGKWLGPCK